jgi:hypothetical protein
MWGLTATLTQEELIRAAMCANHSGQRSGESNADFADRMFLKWIDENVLQYNTDNAEPDRAQIRANTDTQLEGLSL